MGRSYKIKQCSLASGIAIGFGVSIAVALGLAAGAVGLILSETISEESMGLVALGILFLSGLAGSLIAAWLVGRMPAIICGSVVGAFFMFLVGANILLLDGQLGGIGSGLLVLLGSYGIACLASMQKGRGKIKRKKVRSR